MAAGRPRKEIKEEQLKAIMRLKPSLDDVAAFFGCSIDTVKKRIKELSGENFTRFRQQNMVHTRFSLIRKAIQKAENGDNTMLIFCLKNLCGWADKLEQDIEQKPIKVIYNLEKPKEES
jgi:AraC-like DNA-binding protein